MKRRTLKKRATQKRDAVRKWHRRNMSCFETRYAYEVWLYASQLTPEEEAMILHTYPDEWLDMPLTTEEEAAFNRVDLEKCEEWT